jgi:hypothetical protein
LLPKLVNHRPSPSLVISCLALFVAMGSAGYAATGGNFILGNPNSATSQTSLSAGIANKALQVTNMNTGAGATALGLSVAGGKPPFTVNSGTKVANLNADRLDGADSSGFLRIATAAGGDLSGPFSNLQINGSAVGSNEVADFGLSNQDVGVEFAQINADATVANSSGGVTAVDLGTGTYEIDFGHDISSCAFVLTQGEASPGGAGGAITGATDRSGNAEAVFATVRTDANALVDRAFQLVVVC